MVCVMMSLVEKKLLLSTQHISTLYIIYELIISFSYIYEFGLWLIYVQLGIMKQLNANKCSDAGVKYVARKTKSHD